MPRTPRENAILSVSPAIWNPLSHSCARPIEYYLSRVSVLFLLLLFGVVFPIVGVSGFNVERWGFELAHLTHPPQLHTHTHTPNKHHGLRIQNSKSSSHGQPKFNESIVVSWSARISPGASLQAPLSDRHTHLAQRRYRTVCHW